jgi:hypothetical protein
MYYIGTEAECQAYNDEVAAGSNYDMVNCVRWADLIEHKDGGLFAIVAHPDYPSDLESLETLTADWFNEEEL